MLQIQSRAKKALREGMALLSQADVGSALQIFFNLQTLPEVCLGALRDCFAGQASPLVCKQCTRAVWLLAFLHQLRSQG